MKYDLTSAGVPFAGGAILLISNFTNTGQLTIRVTSISFASDFWSNGTRQVTSGLLFNLTAGNSKEVDTPVAVPAGVGIGGHAVTATASWQYSNGTAWFDAGPIAATTTVNVSQTIGSLFASLATNLIIGLAAAVAVSVVVVVVLKKKKSSHKWPNQPLHLEPPYLSRESGEPSSQEPLTGSAFASCRSSL